MLSEINHLFTVIGLTETKFKVNQEQLLNNDLPGYHLSQQTLSNAGGVGILIHSECSYTIRSEMILNLCGLK